jgi:hypothetical protein
MSREEEDQIIDDIDELEQSEIYEQERAVRALHVYTAGTVQPHWVE